MERSLGSMLGLFAIGSVIIITIAFGYAHMRYRWKIKDKRLGSRIEPVEPWPDPPPENDLGYPREMEPTESDTTPTIDQEIDTGESVVLDDVIDLLEFMIIQGMALATPVGRLMNHIKRIRPSEYMRLNNLF